MDDEKKDVTRRDFLKSSGIAAGTLVGGGLVGGIVGYNMNGQSNKDKSDKKKEGSHKGLLFFNNQNDFKILSEATERIFPEDDLGPGAIGLGVPYFIDHQLAGNYGSNAKEYMQGPFHKGEPTQGYQTSLTRAEVFMTGIAALEKEAKKRYDKGFAEIEDKQRDKILTDVQKDKVKMKGVEASFFFDMLRSATLAGAYADPIYAGNENMDGWKMKDFPGHQMSYIQDIEKDKFQKIKPKSLSSMQHE